MDVEAYLLQYARTGKEQEEEDTVPLLIAKISETVIAFSQEGIKEVARCDSVIPIPGMPGYVLGLVNLRGEFEALLDFRHLVSIPIEPIPQIFEALLGIIGETRVSIYVDAVLALIDLPKAQIISPPPDLSGELKSILLGEIVHEEGKIPLLSFTKIITTLVGKRQ